MKMGTGKWRNTCSMRNVRRTRMAGNPQYIKDEMMKIDNIQIHVKGRPVAVPAAHIAGLQIINTGRWIKVARVWDEELMEDCTAAEPASVISQLEGGQLGSDIFTFAQKLTDTTPRYPYHTEWDNFAVVPVTTFDNWWNKQIEPSVRRAVRKSTKTGITTREVELDDMFIKGVVNINDETPVRQGRPFWHFKKDFESVKRENSTYRDRNIFVGAYCDDELIGFLRMIRTDNIASVIQLLSMTRHFEKRPANALIAKAVELCAQREISHFVYCNYVYNDPKSTLTEFKRRNGFEQVLVPRYYVPLTRKGRAAMRLRLHQGYTRHIPHALLSQLLKLRASWYTRKLKTVEGSL